jgi:ATP-dependent helicase HrpA
MSEADLVDEASRGDERDFPARWRQGDQVLSLAYRFEPGAADDGVTAVVPLALLAQVRADGFDWQVPGMRDELITALLRSLPKAIRRHGRAGRGLGRDVRRRACRTGPRSP